MAWPTTSEPRTNFLNLRLTDAEQAELDAYLQMTGLDRSTAARTAMFDTIRSRTSAVQGSLPPKKAGTKAGTKTAPKKGKP